MRFKALLGFAAVLCLQQDLLASTCFVPPPCKALGPASIFFTGVAAGVATHISGVPEESWSEVRFEISEIFEGMPESTKEAVLLTTADLLQKGRSYLVDARRTEDGRLYVAPCTKPGETDGKKDEQVDELLSYLRQRKAGNVDTSLTVAVKGEPIVGAEVTITSSEESRKAQTDSEGKATFRGLRSGHYSVTAALAHYHLDSEDRSGEDVEVLPGTCENALIYLAPETSVTGIVLDSKGAAMANLALQLELATAPDGWSEAITDAEGRFRFDSISPGRYLLGSNISGLYPSTVPSTFYPGQRDRSAAISVEVKLGGSTELPPFRLPDYGPQRTIQICVIDLDGRFVASARIANAHREEGVAGLPDDLVTDPAGCVKTSGYARATYRVHAMLVPGRDTIKASFSDEVVIGMGEEALTQVLKLTR